MCIKKSLYRILNLKAYIENDLLKKKNIKVSFIISIIIVRFKIATLLFVLIDIIKLFFYNFVIMLRQSKGFYWI